MPDYKPVRTKPLSQVGSKLEHTTVSKAEKLVGGKGDNRPDSDFCPIHLKAGIKEEMEHTNDRDKAKEIAKDHLTENAKYYEHLDKMEDKMEDTKKSLGRANDLLKSIKDSLSKEDMDLQKKFQSKKQQKYMYAAADRGEISQEVVDEFSDKTKDFSKLPGTKKGLGDLAKALKALAVLGLSRKARMDAAYNVGVGQGKRAASPFATQDLSGAELNIGVPKEQLRPPHEPPVVPVRRVETPSEIAPKPCSDHTYKTPDNGTAPVKPFWRR